MPFTRFLAAAALSSLSAFSVFAPASGAEQARDPDLQGTSSEGYRVKIYSELTPLQINRIHGWKLVIEDAGGRPVQAARVEVSGGMPDHDHGLPTRPMITGEVEPGHYRLDGLRFHMPGRWQVFVSINQNVSVVLDFTL